MTYFLYNPKTGSRAEFHAFADLLAAWFQTPELVMTTVGLTENEKAVIARLYEQKDELADSQRGRHVTTTRVRYSSEEGVVL